MKSLVSFHQELALPYNRRVTVASFGDHHFFLLVGLRAKPRAEAEVFGPYSTLVEANRRAYTLQQRGYEGVDAV